MDWPFTPSPYRRTSTIHQTRGDDTLTSAAPRRSILSHRHERTRTTRRRGPRGRDLEPGQGAVSATGLHQARSRPLLPGRRRRRAARRGRPAERARPLSERHRRRVLLPEARAASRGRRGSKSCRCSFPSGRTAEEVVPRDAAALAWMANLACLELHPHPVRADGSRSPRRAARRSRSGARRRVAADARGRARRAARRSTTSGSSAGRRHRARAACTSTCASSGAGRSTRCGAPRSRSRARSSAARPALATSKWWKEERHGVFLDYNQNAKDRTVAGAYSVRPTPDARVSAPLDVGRGRRVRAGATSRSRRCPRASRASATGTRASTRSAARSSALLELSARHEREGLGDAPWPPHYTKQAGEPPRVQPSRRRAPSRSARSRSAAPQRKEDALAGLERWKARHPEAAAHLEPADVLVDAMRGRFTHLDAHPREPAARAGRAAAGAGSRSIPTTHRTTGQDVSPDERSRAEDLLELVRRRDLELIVAAVGRLACRAASAGRPPRGGSDRPAGGRTSPRTRARCAAAPTTDPCPRSSGSARRASRRASAARRPPTRATGCRRARVSRSGASSDASCLRIAIVNADVTPTCCSVPFVVVQPEQQRADACPRRSCASGSRRRRSRRCARA